MALVAPGGSGTHETWQWICASSQMLKEGHLSTESGQGAKASRDPPESCGHQVPLNNEFHK